MNPFKQAMVEMQTPPDGGTAVSVEGWMIEAGKDGMVEVPQRLVPTLECHGYTVPGPKPAKK